MIFRQDTTAADIPVPVTYDTYTENTLCKFSFHLHSQVIGLFHKSQ